MRPDDLFVRPHFVLTQMLTQIRIASERDLVIYGVSAIPELTGVRPTARYTWHTRSTYGATPATDATRPLLFYSVFDANVSTDAGAFPWLPPGELALCRRLVTRFEGRTSDQAALETDAHHDAPSQQFSRN
jgi:hypothetical protein